MPPQETEMPGMRGTQRRLRHAVDVGDAQGRTGPVVRIGASLSYPAVVDRGTSWERTSRSSRSFTGFLRKGALSAVAPSSRRDGS